jgi:hypothetical protein
VNAARSTHRVSIPRHNGPSSVLKLVLSLECLCTGSYRGKSNGIRYLGCSHGGTEAKVPFQYLLAAIPRTLPGKPVPFLAERTVVNIRDKCEKGMDKMTPRLRSSKTGRGRDWSGYVANGGRGWPGQS